ncbi:MAG: biotin/lipoyl-binding protein, partial [Planctomycetota bacterium]
MKFNAVAAVALKRGLPAVGGLVVLVLVTAWLAGAFTKKIPGGQAAVAGEEADSSPGYGTYEVNEIEKSYIEEAIGTVKAASRTEISARVLATIDRIAVGAGDTVAEGDVLIELDRKAFEAQLSQAEAALAATDAAVEQARDAHERAVRLRQSNPGAIADQDLNRMNSELLGAQAKQTGAGQAVEEAKVRLNYTTIRTA